MSRALAMRENQVRAILRAARKESMRIEVKIGDVIVTAFPTDYEQAKRLTDQDDEIRL